MGNWIFGWDVCQDICPWQRFATETNEDRFRPVDANRTAPRLLDLLALDEATFKMHFGGSPVERIKRERLVRNACIAAGNWGSDTIIPALNRLLEDASSLVRGHAAWALHRIAGAAAAASLSAAYRRETDETGRVELAALLD